MIDQKLIRQEFDFFDDIAYLDVSLTAMPPNRVRAAVNSYISDYTAGYGRAAGPYYHHVIEEARRELAKLLDCAPYDLAFGKNTGDGITVFANSYRFLPGDNVVVTDQEHASNLYPWYALERNGVEVIRVRCPGDEVSIDNIMAACSEKTRVVAIASTHYCTGFSVDLSELGRRCKDRGILFVVDAIQSMGRLAIYPKRMNIDFLACGSHKGLMGTKGAGVFYCNPDIVERIIPFTASMQSVSTVSRPPAERSYGELAWHNDARRFESGNYNYIGILSMSKGAGLINEIGINNIEAHVRSLEDILRKRLEHIPLRAVKPADPANRSGILFIFHPEHMPREAVDAILLKHGVYATVRGGYIRMGIHCYNTERHMNMTADALEELSKAGAAS